MWLQPLFAVVTKNDASIDKLGKFDFYNLKWRSQTASPLSTFMETNVCMTSDYSAAWADSFGKHLVWVGSPSSPGSRKDPHRIMLLGRSARDRLLPRGEDPYRLHVASLGGPMLLERDILGVPLDIGATFRKEKGLDK